MFQHVYSILRHSYTRVHALTYIVVECTTSVIRINFRNTSFAFIKKKVHVYSTIEGHGNGILVLKYVARHTETGERICCMTENMYLYHS
jgi:hypothetical protein